MVKVRICLIDFMGWGFLFCRLLAMTLTMMTITGMLHLNRLCWQPLMTYLHLVIVIDFSLSYVTVLCMGGCLMRT